MQTHAPEVTLTADTTELAYSSAQTTEIAPIATSLLPEQTQRRPSRRPFFSPTGLGMSLPGMAFTLLVVSIIGLACTPAAPYSLGIGGLICLLEALS